MSKSTKTAIAVLVIGVIMYWALFTKDVQATKRSITFDVGFDMNDVVADPETTWGDRQEESGAVIMTTR